MESLQDFVVPNQAAAAGDPDEFWASSSFPAMRRSISCVRLKRNCCWADEVWFLSIHTTITVWLIWRLRSCVCVCVCLWWPTRCVCVCVCVCVWVCVCEPVAGIRKADAGISVIQRPLYRLTITDGTRVAGHRADSHGVSKGGGGGGNTTRPHAYGVEKKLTFSENETNTCDSKFSELS